MEIIIIIIIIITTFTSLLSKFTFQQLSNARLLHEKERGEDEAHQASPFDYVHE
jgi:Mg2+/Co2+ transporter CorB